jgi:glycosyltransferase involved in cell wall biosynthesis
MAGRPVVTTDVGSTSEVVVHGRTGFVCERSVDSLEAALHPLLADELLRREMGDAAGRVCQTKFSAERLVADVDRIYTSLLAGSALLADSADGGAAES